MRFYNISVCIGLLILNSVNFINGRIKGLYKDFATFNSGGDNEWTFKTDAKKLGTCNAICQKMG